MRKGHLWKPWLRAEPQIRAREFVIDVAPCANANAVSAKHIDHEVTTERE